ncbi:Uncharacterised protein [Vibrio cholerae]|nr:Uncharacterised protein [Vibrio cholerae]
MITTTPRSSMIPERKRNIGGRRNRPTLNGSRIVKIEGYID